MARAPKVTVELSPGFKKKIAGISSQVVDEKFAATAGPVIVTEMRRLIASGISPVKGFGRFAPYKNPDKYPGGKKPSRPVNLSLTGTMLKHLSFRRNANQLEIGILPSAPNKTKVIARVHNTGERPDIAQRQFIPFQGQEFTASIMVKVRALFRKRILDLLKA